MKNNKMSDREIEARALFTLSDLSDQLDKACHVLEAARQQKMKGHNALTAISLSLEKMHESINAYYNNI